jgi:hypothetical protein
MLVGLGPQGRAASSYCSVNKTEPFHLWSMIAQESDVEIQAIPKNYIL